MEPETIEWARSEFGGAKLGDTRRTDRLIEMAAAAAERPSGRLTEVFSVESELLAAYRHVINANNDPKEAARAAFRASAVRAREKEIVIVPVDGSTMAVPWATAKNAFGPLGSSSQKTRGMQVMSAISVLPDGTPLGLAGQIWWVRKETSEKTAKKLRRNRPLRQKETQHWLSCINEVEKAHIDVGASAKLWFQLDAGADFGEMIHWAYQAQLDNDRCWVTLRAAHDRRLSEQETGWIRYLWEKCAEQPIIGTKILHIVAGKERTEREARIEISSVPVTLDVKDHVGRPQKAKMTAVLATERNTTPEGEKPIEWLLLTTHAIHKFEDAMEAVDAYSRRWDIENFHRVWKDTCKSEKNQFRSPGSLIYWATILAVVAMRIQRLTYLARNQPDAPATEELTQNEIDATIILQKPEGYSPGDVPTIEKTVLWIALLGGYRKRTRNPPGPKVVGRGLVKVEMAAEILASGNVLIKKKCDSR